ncbi:MAG: permease [Planctomyces sp.]
MLSIMFWGFILRFVQCLAQASPFILCGFIAAAVLKRFFGYQETRRLFGGDGRWGLLRAWIIGMLLPVCSLGVVPMLRELKRAGLAGGTILAFAMAAPLFNPLSLLYGLTLSEPIAIVCFAGCSLVIVTIIGTLFDRLHGNSSDTEIQLPPAPFGIRRMLAVGVTCALEATGPSLVIIFVGLAGVALLGAVIPAGGFQHAFNSDNAAAPLLMMAMAIPVYATPMQAMSQLGMMFQHANSIGAAFVLLILGAGMNLGLVYWLWREYGTKRTLSFMAMLLTVVVALAYGIQDPLFPKDIEPANHTHAFDIYSQPFHSSVSTGSLPSLTAEKLSRDIQIFEWHSLKLLAGLAAIGVVLRVADPKKRLEAWIEQRPEEATTPRMDLILPPSVIGLFCLGVLVAVSVAGCYAYYPTAREALAEMYIIRGEALTAARTGQKAEAEYWIDLYADWSRKMEVGVYLREWNLSEYHRWKARLLREQLELLKHEVEDDEKDEVRKLCLHLGRTHARMRSAFTDELESSGNAVVSGAQ